MNALPSFPLSPDPHQAAPSPAQARREPAGAGLDLITLRGLVLHQEVRRDILVSRSGDVETAVWLRKARIDFQQISGGLVDVTLPADLAAERGLA